MTLCKTDEIKALIIADSTPPDFCFCCPRARKIELRCTFVNFSGRYHKGL